MIKSKWIKSVLLLKLTLILMFGMTGNVFAHGSQVTNNCSGNDTVSKSFGWLSSNRFSLEEDGDKIVSGTRDGEGKTLSWSAEADYSIVCVKVQGSADGEWTTQDLGSGSSSGSDIKAPQEKYQVKEKVGRTYKWVTYFRDQTISEVIFYYKQLPKASCAANTIKLTHTVSDWGSNTFELEHDNQDIIRATVSGQWNSDYSLKWNFINDAQDEYQVSCVEVYNSDGKYEITNYAEGTTGDSGIEAPKGKDIKKVVFYLSKVEKLAACPVDYDFSKSYTVGNNKDFTITYDGHDLIDGAFSSDKKELAWNVVGDTVEETYDVVCVKVNWKQESKEKFEFVTYGEAGSKSAYGINVSGNNKIKSVEFFVKKTVIIVETPSPLPTIIPSPSPEETEIPEETVTPTPVETEIPTPTPFETESPEETPAPTPVETEAPEDTPTPQGTPAPVETEIPQETATPEETPSPVETETPEETATPVETETPEETATPVETETPQETATPVETDTPQETETPVETDTPQETATPVETDTPEETATPVETETPEETATPVETDTPEETATPVETDTPEETEAPVETDTPEETATPVETETPEETSTPVETESPNETATPDETPEPTVTPEPTASPEEETVVEDDETPAGTVEDEETQTGSVEDETVVVEEGEAPQGSVDLGSEEDEATVVDNEVPLAALPKTGQSSTFPIYLAGIFTIGLGIWLMRRKTTK